MPHKLEQKDENNCKLKIYSKRESRVPLCITDFSHGQVKINAPSELQFHCFKEGSNEQKAESELNRCLVATNGRLNYVGSCSNVSSLRYFVGVRDKKSGKIKLYDCVIFRMKPKLQMVSRNIQSAPKTYKESLDMLTENFGSKARKRALSLKQRSTVDTSLVTDVSVISAVSQPSTEKCLNDNSCMTIDYLPPVNRIASSVNDVFNIRYIISLEEDTSLSGEAQELLAAPLDKFTKMRFSFCKYVSVRFENLSAEKAKYLLYFNYLIIFQQLKYTDMRKKDPTSNIPDTYKKKMLEKFTVISRTMSGKPIRSCSSQMKDKIVSYILVLALFIDEYVVNLEEIAEELSNIRVPKLSTIAEALGCYITKKKIGEQITKHAELKLPLNVPIPKFVRKSIPNKKV